MNTQRHPRSRSSHSGGSRSSRATSGAGSRCSGGAGYPAPLLLAFPQPPKSPTHPCHPKLARHSRWIGDLSPPRDLPLLASPGLTKRDLRGARAQTAQGHPRSPGFEPAALAASIPKHVLSPALLPSALPPRPLPKEVSLGQRQDGEPERSRGSRGPGGLLTHGRGGSPWTGVRLAPTHA